MKVKLGDRWVGDGEPVYIIAEIGLNHNGSLDTALELIDVAKQAGCDCVKFQKRRVDKVYSPVQLSAPRVGPFGKTYGDEKHALEFGLRDYDTLTWHCKEIGIDWSASCWDEDSVEFIASYEPPFLKIPSPVIRNGDLLEAYIKTGLPIVMSTGLCSGDDVERALFGVSINGHSFDLDKVVLLHCVSAYPCPVEHLNLRAIKTLRERFNVPVGYSGHEVGIPTTAAAVCFGACIIERHITLDKTTYGSDHSASIEPVGLERLVRYIRSIEKALGDGVKRVMPVEDRGKIPTWREG